MREVAVRETGNFRGVCPILNRAKEYPAVAVSVSLWAWCALSEAFYTFPEQKSFGF